MGRGPIHGALRALLSVQGRTAAACRAVASGVCVLRVTGEMIIYKDFTKSARLPRMPAQKWVTELSETPVAGHEVEDP